MQKDGNLLLSAPLRREMESVLEEMQSDVKNELEKVSLERLADLNPDLLANIKLTAEETMRSGSFSKPQDPSSASTSNNTALPSFLMEPRSKESLARSKAWSEFKWDATEQSKDIITQLQSRVNQDSGPDKLYTQQEALQMTQYLAAASATASILQSALDHLQSQEDQLKNQKSNASMSKASVKSGAAFVVDRSLFTNDGIKTKNDTVIGLLYEVGLPFLSSADGRRFASQLELSKHLDVLFKRNQLEKSIARTEERGWYIPDMVWTGQAKESDFSLQAGATAVLGDAPLMALNEGQPDDGYSPETSSMPADESRDRCVICGINFKMFFDNDDGMYKYKNCREIKVLNDDAADREFEEMLVHVTCWRGLGSPEVLTSDQALQETLHHQ